jgi:hypothetical protein
MTLNKTIIILLAIGIVLCTAGCIEQSISDKQLSREMQLFLDTPADPANEDILTPEERAIVKSFEIYRNTIKVHLADDSAQEMRKPISRKIVKVFGLASREMGLLQPTYYLELYVSLVVDNERGVFKVADARFENMSERVYVEEYAATRSRR